ncbi:MAG: hypothetical protein Q9218_003616 [Villophora microphyllina]
MSAPAGAHDNNEHNHYSNFVYIVYYSPPGDSLKLMRIHQSPQVALAWCKPKVNTAPHLNPNGPTVTFEPLSHNIQRITAKTSSQGIATCIIEERRLNRVLTRTLPPPTTTHPQVGDTLYLVCAYGNIAQQDLTVKYAWPLWVQRPEAMRVLEVCTDYAKALELARPLQPEGLGMGHGSECVQQIVLEA